MNRLLLPLFLFLCILLPKLGNAQAETIWLHPSGAFSNGSATLCFVSPAVVQQASVVAAPPGTTQHSWAVVPPAGCSVAPTYTCLSSDCSTVNITYGCCGVYTVAAAALNTTLFTTPPQTVFLSGDTAQATILCPNSGSASVTPSIVCRGYTVQLTGNGGTTPNSYTWFPSSGPTFTGNPVVLSPSVNTSFTMIATTAQGCTVFAITSVSVQGANISVTPASQTMCLGSQVCFTAQTSSSSGSTVTPGTSTTLIQWFAPPSGNLFASGSNAYKTCTTAAVGDYTAVLTHTGSAGTCTVQAISSVAIGTAINVSASGHSTQVCPGANFSITAVSIQTAASSYTWTDINSGVSVVGNPAVFQPTTNTCYTLHVDYTGCPGFATVCVTMASLTPTLTPSSPDICPGTCFTLSATGGSTYTYYELDANNIPYQIGPANTTGNAVACPSVLCTTYSVSAFSAGCRGSALTTVCERTIHPNFGTTRAAACASTQVTFTMTGVGPTTNYTINAPYPPTKIYSGTANSFAHNLPGKPPYFYSLLADSAGCKGSAFTTVSEYTINPIITASSASTCPSQQFTLTSTGGAGTSYTFWAAYPTFSTNIGNTKTIVHTPPSIPPSGNVYTVTVDSANCKGKGTYTMGILNLGPRILPSAAPSISICPNTDFTVCSGMGAGTNFTFTGPGTIGTIPPSSANCFTLNLPTVANTFTIKADSAGCTGQDTIRMFRRILYPTLTASPDPVCAGMPVTLTATGGTNTAFTFFAPNPNATPPFDIVGNPGQFSNTAVQNPGPTTGMTYTVFADSIGCQGIGFYTISIAPGLNVTALASTATVCSGQSATLSAVGPTNAIYSWTQIEGTNSPTPVTGGSNLNYSQASQGIVVNPTVNTSYIVYAVNPSGCTGTAVVTVSINPTASLSLVVSPNATICPQQSTTLSVSGTNSYTWAPGGSLNTATSPTVIASPTVSTNYTVVGTNNAGCYGTATVQVVVNGFPTITIVPTAYAVCPGFNSTLTAFGATSYTWYANPNANPPPAFTVVAQQSVAVGPGTYTVLGSNGGTCIKDNTITITIAPPLNIKATSSSPTTCIANNFPKFSQPLTLNASGAGSYVWQPYNPAHMTYSLGPTTTVRPPASTCYTVTGYTSICSGTAVVCVTVIPQFSMNVTPPLPAICVGDSVKLSVVNIATANIVGPTSAFTYSWTENEDAPPISMSSYLTPTTMIFPQNTTTYTVQVRDARKCASLPKLVTVTVFPRPIPAIAIPTINSVATNTVCYVGVHTGPPDVVITLEGRNLNQNLPFGVVPTYTWLQPYKAPYNSILTPNNQNQVTVSAPLRAPSVVVYTLVMGYNGVPGCAQMDTAAVRVIDCRPISFVEAPLWVVADEMDTVCSRQCITFVSITDTMAGGPQTFTWTFKGGNPATSYEKNPIVCYNLPNPGGWDVILRVSNPYPIGEGSSKIIGMSKAISVVDIPNISIVDPGNLRSDTTVRFGTPISLTAKGGLTYEWAPNYNISATSGSNVVVKPFRSTQYVVTGYNSKYCLSSDTIDVIVIEDCGEMFVPNAFSPNGDGHNDVLKVNGICLETLYFVVFNRWGEKVFETSDQLIGWDGSYKGELMNTGVFVYRLEGKTYDGKAFSAKGNITLIR
jgi:gliding motility-associated-like protein